MRPLGARISRSAPFGSHFGCNQLAVRLRPNQCARRPARQLRRNCGCRLACTEEVDPGCSEWPRIADDLALAEHAGHVLEVLQHPVGRFLKHLGQVFHREALALENLLDAQIHEAGIGRCGPGRRRVAENQSGANELCANVFLHRFLFVSLNQMTTLKQRAGIPRPATAAVPAHSL